MVRDDLPDLPWVGELRVRHAALELQPAPRGFRAPLLEHSQRSGDPTEVGPRGAARDYVLPPGHVARQRAGPGAAMNAGRWRRAALLAGVMLVVSAHIGSPDTYFEGPAGPYRVRVIVRSPG